jgi:hypothetical protein
MFYNILMTGRNTGNFKLMRLGVVCLTIFLLVGCPAPSTRMKVTSTQSTSLTIDLWEEAPTDQAERIGPAYIRSIAFERTTSSRVNEPEVLWEIQAIGPIMESGQPENSVLLGKLVYGNLPPGFQQTQPPVKLQPNETVNVVVYPMLGISMNQSVKISR